MTPEQKANIDALRMAFTEADAKRNEASAALRSAVIAISPFLPGDTIRSSRGDLAFVRSIIAFHSGGPVMNCRKVKKDGTPSERINYLSGDEWKNPALHHRPDPCKS